MTDQPDPGAIIKQLRMEEQEGGLLFHLRGSIDLLVKYHTEKQLQVELWRNGGLLPPDTGNLYSSTFRERLVRSAGATLIGSREKGRAQLLRELGEDLGLVAALMSHTGADGETLHSKLETSGRSIAERLVVYAREGSEFFHTPDGEVYAGVTIGDHVEHYKVGPRAEAFKLWLRRQFWVVERRRIEAAAEDTGGILGTGTFQLPEAVREQVLTDALLQLQSLGRFDGPEAEVYKRIASVPGEDERAVYIDLGDADWRVVEAKPSGWKVIAGTEAPVKFARRPGMLPLPEPEVGGSLEHLRELLHLGTGEEEERNWRLITAWLVHALTLDGPYSILALLGNQGASKSVTQQILRNLVDPNIAPLRYKPKEERDLYIAAANGWVISLDNMSRVPEWLSNALCNICTHGAFGIRRNYSDDDEVLFKARRTIVINGIGDILTYPDLLDRAAIIRLPPFEETPGEKRMTEAAVYARAEEIAPAVFGSLLDALVHYLAVKDSIPDPQERVRMLDFAKCGIAVEQALGAKEGSFMKAYAISRGDANMTALEAYPIAAVLIDLVEDYDAEDPWEGTASQLLAELNGEVDEELRHARGWPRQPSELGSQLNRLATDLHRAGVQVERFTRKGTRMLRIFSGV